MIHFVRSLVLIGLLMVSGCATQYAVITPGVTVFVKDKKRKTHCNGAVVGSRHVVTLGHCTRSHDDLYVIVGWLRTLIKAKVVRRIVGDKDTVVLLELAEPIWAPGEIFDINAGGTPFMALTRNFGVLVWKRAKSRPGDSGSPVIDDKGNLVGLIRGHRKDGSATMEKIPKGLLKNIDSPPLRLGK